MAEASSAAGPRRAFVVLVVAELVTLAILAGLMIQYDLGWLGAVIMVVAVGGFTLAIVRTAERRAKASGNCSSAMTRYNRRMLVASAIYVAGLFAAILAHDNLALSTSAAFLVALLPSIGVLMMVWAMARLVTEETDEYLRYRYVRASLFGLGTLLTLATVWGFFEQFDLVPHAPAWAAVPVFALGLGIAQCTRLGRE